MKNQKVAYAEEQIEAVKVVLSRSNETIHFLQKTLAENNIEPPALTSADEIATCIRILETESEYV
ncbi:MAG: hypothetical protein WBB23_06885 [Desulforhopalus sp.]